MVIPAGKSETVRNGERGIETALPRGKIFGFPWRISVNVRVCSRRSVLLACIFDTSFSYFHKGVMGDVGESGAPVTKHSSLPECSSVELLTEFGFVWFGKLWSKWI